MSVSMPGALAVKAAASLAFETSAVQHAAAAKPSLRASEQSKSTIDGSAAAPPGWYNQQERQQQLSLPPGGTSTSGSNTAGKTAVLHDKHAHAEDASVAGGKDWKIGSATYGHAGDAPGRKRVSIDLSQAGHAVTFKHISHAGSGSMGRPASGHDSQPQRSHASAPDMRSESYKQRRPSMDAAGQLSGNKSARALSRQSSRLNASVNGGASLTLAPERSATSIGGSLANLIGLGSRMFKSAASVGDGTTDDGMGDDLWFTSLDDFKPLCHMLHRGRYVTSYFACAHKTGQHFLLKKYEKHKMKPAEERGVRRAINFAELISHKSLVRCMGHWESEDTIYVVEEYAGKGDVFNDIIARPEKYTERFVALSVVKPMLQVLEYLHLNNIIHRGIVLENLLFGIDDVLRLSSLVTAIDQHADRPKSRLGLLDYMPPEMLSIREHNEEELALAADSSSSDEEDRDGVDELPGSVPRWPGLSGPGTASGRRTSDSSSARTSNPGSAPATSSLIKAASFAKRSSGGSGSINASDTAVGTFPRAAASLRPQPVHSSPRAERYSPGGGTSEVVGAASNWQASWERRDYYDEKVDVWQVGCVVHELLCGCTAFDLEDLLMTAGLIMWADVDQAPGNLTPDCLEFIQAALTKDPQQRPSASQLLKHPWILRHERGEAYHSGSTPRDQQGYAAPWSMLGQMATSAIATAFAGVGAIGRGLRAGWHWNRVGPEQPTQQQQEGQQKQQQEQQQRQSLQQRQSMQDGQQPAAETAQQEQQRGKPVVPMLPLAEIMGTGGEAAVHVVVKGSQPNKDAAKPAASPIHSPMGGGGSHGGAKQAW